MNGGGGSASAGGGGGGVADNKLCIVEHDQRGDAAMIASVAEAPHPYPISKVQWAPASSSTPNLLATSGDYLRIWRFGGSSAGADSSDGLVVESLLANQSKADLVAPLTAFDWNETSPNLVVTSSIDTTCTVWDVTTAQAKTQLIAHDREVFDVGFASGTADIFASVGADGSVRLFDLRALEHSTIIYEHPQSAPLLRVAWNRQDPNYLAVVAYESHSIHILDVRVPSVAVAELAGHTTCVNAVAWHPKNSGYLMSAGDDGRVLVWDVGAPTPARKGAGGAAAALGGSATLGGSAALAASATGSEPAVYAPLLAHAPHPQGAEVENLCISHLADWVAVTAASQVKLLRL
ncbi:WD40-repeat-containing domain protein [Catenaria anguillulae PL171]|uniref:WD40-repeat-containing domain protein n=1 Tax=Catenaria anguillulae PL171 TaxID=765915 RepID=A0A1Y2H4J8_9FUNG|nr:WD40-repeat-containing domain protein [Catenaria anguillulae PL171]